MLNSTREQLKIKAEQDDTCKRDMMRPVCNLQPLAKHMPGVWYQYPEGGKCGSNLAEEKPEAQGNYAALSEIHPCLYYCCIWC